MLEAVLTYAFYCHLEFLEVDMTSAGRPWSPPLPSDPERNPLYAPTPAFFPSPYSGSQHSLPGSNEAFLAAGGLDAHDGNHPPTSFAHVPPGSRSSHDGTDVGGWSEGVGGGRTSTEKRSHLYGSLGQSSAAGGLAGFAGAGERERTDSATRFVRHEDAGEAPTPAGAADAEEEVVELPPLYQDAGRPKGQQQPSVDTQGRQPGLPNETH